jgi:alkanesulfonate monooxygenase SsuD/methylene tetrahydromethanopterin reductase-like flavin-dependent oxidoreductase (luciferase family)
MAEAKRGRGMKFGNFLFPDSRDPARDGIVIDETLREAVLSDELGIDVVWLGEHHFDGICAYADPITLAGALAIALKRAALGFAVLQTSLHHPIRLAEQLAIIDHLTKGRLVVGLGRGSSYNIYDYQGFGIDHHEAQARLDEAEHIIVKAWTEDAFRHDGRFWQLDVPILRPRPLHQAASAADPRLVGRRLARRIGAAGEAVLDERAVLRDDAAPGRALCADDARGRPRR